MTAGEDLHGDWLGCCLMIVSLDGLRLRRNRKLHGRLHRCEACRLHLLHQSVLLVKLELGHLRRNARLSHRLRRHLLINVVAALHCFLFLKDELVICLPYL